MKETAQLMQKHFIENMCSTGMLFTVEITGKEVWNTYLKSFSEENNPKFRDPDSTSHNCNTCNNFIKRYGNIVAIDDRGLLITLFDSDCEDEYKDSFMMMAALVGNSKITNVFKETYNELNSLPYESCNKIQQTYKLGIASNTKRYTKKEAEIFGVVKPNEIRKFHHFNLDLPKQFVDITGKSIESIKAKYRDKYNVFKRGMEEISLDTFKLVKDLISQNSLLNGESYLGLLTEIIKLKEVYIEDQINENWFWIQTYSMSEGLAKFRNTLLGTLCVELTEGKNLNEACLTWNKRADPTNYMKAQAPITEAQKKEAFKFIEKEGYLPSFERRFAVLDDIKVSEIQHINIDNEVKMKTLFDNIPTAKKGKDINLDKIETVDIDKFMNEILPECDKVELLFENKHQNNLAVFTTAQDEDTKPIFKWDNNYSWTFANNLAGKSEIKEKVKTAGGAVDGVLRFSIMWAKNNADKSDLDAHCKVTPGTLIYYSSRIDYGTMGELDIDIVDPPSTGAVENITFPDLDKLEGTKFDFLVHQFTARNSKGFQAEIAFGDEVFEYSYDKPLSNKQKIKVATVSVKNGQFSIEHHLPCENTSQEVWGLNTKEFHKVNLVCLSPNYWGDNKVGNKHYFFMLNGCKSDSQLRTFHSENLHGDLLKQRKVIDVLGSFNTVEPNKNHLAGVGFNATVNNEVILKCSGTFNRMLKVKI